MSNLSLKQTLAILLGLFVFGFALGRYTVPEKVKTETKVVTQDQKMDSKSEQLDSDKNEHKIITQTELIKPDGTKEITTKTVDDTSADTKMASLDQSSEAFSQTSTQTKEVTKGGDKVTILLLVGPSISLSSGIGPLNYGAHISKPILGPITVGIWGLSNGTGGLSAGLTF